MDQWGLALESSGKLSTSSSLNNTFFYSSNYNNINKTNNNNNNSNNNRNRNEKNYNMEYNKNVDDEDNKNMQHQNDEDVDDHKVVIGEVDFFSNHKNKLDNYHLNHVKQDNSSPTRPHLDVNVSFLFHLCFSFTNEPQ